MKKTQEKSILGIVILTFSLFFFSLFLCFFLSGNGLPSGCSGNGMREFRDILHSGALPEKSGRRLRNASRIFQPAARQNRFSEDRPDAVALSDEELFSLYRLYMPECFHFSRLHASAGILVSHPARASPEIC